MIDAINSIIGAIVWLGILWILLAFLSWRWSAFRSPFSLYSGVIRFCLRGMSQLVLMPLRGLGNKWSRQIASRKHTDMWRE